MYGEIPCVRCLSKEEIEGAYEKNTGLLIADYFADKDYEAVPAVLCKNHGPFTWGKDAHEAVHNAVVLEEGMHDSAYFRKCFIQFQMGRCIGRGVIFPFYLIPFQIHDYHVLRCKFVVFHTAGLNHKRICRK